jgi:hypothetical protein
MKKFGGVIGPASTYSPILEAWRSGRTTTKYRDYVLAVFPDINGYIVPSNARKMRFPELLADALQQAPVRDRFDIAPKIPRGMMLETSSKDSIGLWVLSEPSNVGEAYDSFITELRSSEERKTSPDEKFFTITKALALEELDLDRSNLLEVKELWVRGSDILKHFAFLSPTGPCTGTSRYRVQTPEGLLHQYFVHEFNPIAIAQYLSSSRLASMSFRTEGVLSFKPIEQISRDTFAHELKRYLVCMMCGTSLSTADVVLGCAAFRVLSTPYGNILALIRQDVLDQSGEHNFILFAPSLWFMQGFLVGIQTRVGVVAVGRTFIPSRVLWDAITASLG